MTPSTNPASKRRGQITRPINRLAIRLESDCGLKVDVSSFARTRAGHWQRSSGAWSWWMYADIPKTFAKVMVGSQYSVKTLLNSPKLQVGRNWAGEIDVDPA